MIKEKNVSILWFLELLTRYTIIRCFSTIRSGGNRERGIEGSWDGAAISRKSIPIRQGRGLQRTGQGRRKLGIWGEHLHCRYADLQMKLTFSARKGAV